MNRTHLLALGLCLLTACFEKADDDDDDDDGDGSGGGTVTEEQFLDQYAQLVCDWYAECDYLEYFGGSIEECIDQLDAAIGTTFGPEGDCTFDPVLASQCLDEIESAFGGGDCDPDTETSTGTSACEQMCDHETEVDTGWDTTEPVATE